MTERLAATLPLTCWRGERGTYHLVTITGDAAERLAMHERLHRLEFGSRRGFGSVRVMARIGETQWKSSVFPQRAQSEWILLVGRKVMKAEGLGEGDATTVELELL